MEKQIFGNIVPSKNEIDEKYKIKFVALLPSTFEI